MKTTFFKALLLTMALGGFSQTSYAAEATPAKKPNILFIALDDLNAWVGYLGKNKQTITPNIDKLAARGLSFTHSYCAAPVCNPSRAALMSGLRPFSSGIYHNGNDWRTAIGPELTIPTTFKNAGYNVFGSGKIYHGSYDRKSDWTDYLETERGNPQPAGDKGVGGIKFGAVDAKDEDISDYGIVSYGIEQLQKKHDKPFLLTVGLHKPHMPWYVPQKYFDLHPLDKIELQPTLKGDLDDVPPAGIRFAKPQGDHQQILESGRWKEAVQAYLAAISYADAQIGRLIDALDHSEYGKDTIIVLWGDHGWHLGEKEHWRKFALWEETTRAPLIWVVPGLTKPNSVTERTVDFMSVYPTLTDLAGIPTPAHVEGKSIRPLLVDPKAEWKDPAITTYQFNNHTVRTEDWRYIRYANGDEELYDEKNDPNEWTNLAGKAEFAEKKAELAKLIPTRNAPDLGTVEKGGNAQGKKARQKEED